MPITKGIKYVRSISWPLSIPPSGKIDGKIELNILYNPYHGLNSEYSFDGQSLPNKFG